MTTAPPNKTKSPASVASGSERLGLRDAWTLSLAEMDGTAGERFACRAVASTLGRLFLGADNAAEIGTAQDPFILALNHSQRPEALVIPAWLALLRGGRRVHFMADWTFLLVPVLGHVIRAGRSIIVGRKPARPAFLNRFKSRLVPAESPMQQAKRLLLEGHSIGIFVEGTTNRNPHRLLRGLTGAARLALDTDVPIIPAGVVFPRHDVLRPIGDLEPFRLRFGDAITPCAPPAGHAAGADAERDLHARVMKSISGLCGKTWSPENPRTKHAN